MSRFSKNQVSKLDDYPKGPHFVALHFTTRYVPHVDIYCFTEQADLQAFVEDSHLNNRSIIFYKVERLGKVSTVTTVTF